MQKAPGGAGGLSGGPSGLGGLAGLAGVAAATALMVTVGTSLWRIRALMLLPGWPGHTVHGVTISGTRPEVSCSDLFVLLTYCS